MFTDDPIADFYRYDREQQEWLDRLPKCEHCCEPIQDEKYYEIEGVKVCENCLTDYCDKHYRACNTEL